MSYGPFELSYQKDRIHFRFPFQIAHGMRTGTDVVYVRLSGHGHVGYGEAALPPYLPSTQESVVAWLDKARAVLSYEYPDLQALHKELTAMAAPDFPALAALDMALWQIASDATKMPMHTLFGLGEPGAAIPHTYTIGICEKSEMHAKVKFAEANGFQVFKLKLDGKNDQRMVADFRSLSECPFAVDVNQGWTDLGYAREMVHRLEEAGAILVEQPFHKSDLSMSAALRSNMRIPLIADEACQRLADMEALADAFDGVNIKLQKCGGVTEAIQMIRRGRELGFFLLIGCMSESMTGIAPAEELALFCDCADLDGPFLIKENPKMSDVFIAQ